MSLENSRYLSSLESTPSCERRDFADSPHSVNVDSFSIESSLMGSSEDQESVFCIESQNVLKEENGSETFSVLQSPESVAALTPEDDDAPEVLKGSNGESEVGTSPARSSLASGSPLLLAGDNALSDGAECNWSPTSEQNEIISKPPAQDEERCSILHKTEGTLAKLGVLDSLEETNPEKRMSGDVKASLSAEDSSGQEAGVETHTEQKEQLPLTDPVPASPLPAPFKEESCLQESALPGQDFREPLTANPNASAASEWISNTSDAAAERSASSDEEDIYRHGLPYSSSETSVTEMGGCLPPQEKVRTSLDEGALLKSDQVCA